MLFKEETNENHWNCRYGSINHMAHILTNLGVSIERPLIAVFSCIKHRKWHQLARDTWLKNCPVDYAFFLGGAPNFSLAADERLVDAPDDRLNIFRKTKRIVEYTVNEGYSHLFKLDIDTYCHVPRLLKSGFEKQDWVGYGEPYGGSGYWLSRKAMAALLENNTDYPSLESEDSWVARNLKNLGMTPYLDPRYHSLTNMGPSEGNDIITSHWYSEHNADGERPISFEERISLISGYHERAIQILCGTNGSASIESTDCGLDHSMTHCLIAVTSYFPDATRGCHQAIREGWGKDVAPAGADLRFFVPFPHFADPPEYGDNLRLDSYQPHTDEVWLKMNGLYTNISYQVQNILKYSLEQDYDFTHVCANDTFIIPRRVFEQYDWKGVWDQQRVNRKNPIEEISYGYSKNSDRRPLPFGELFNWWWYNTRIPDLYGWMGGGAGMTFSKKAAQILVSEDLNKWISRHDFWGFGYDSLFGQILGPHIRDNQIVAKNDEGFSWHYEHSPNEQRYAGVCEWQKKMYQEHAQNE